MLVVLPGQFSPYSSKKEDATKVIRTHVSNSDAA